MQHFDRGGVSAAPFSSSVNERGRWMTQIWPCASTVMPPTWPRIQLFGSGFGQDASTANVGMSPASAGCESADAPISNVAVRKAKAALERLKRARSSTDIMVASPLCSWRGFPHWVRSQSRGEAGVNHRGRHGEKQTRRLVGRSATSEGGRNPCPSKRQNGLLRSARNDGEKLARRLRRWMKA